jgi:hypothetical protein
MNERDEKEEGREGKKEREKLIERLKRKMQLKKI